MMKGKYALSAFFSACLMAAGLGGVAQAEPSGTLVFCSEGSPAGFDTMQYTSGIEVEAGTNMLYNGLVRFQRGESKVVPDLAESWDVSADGKEWTFRLRSGVKFHSNKDFKPTRDFNADDVIATYDRLMNPDNAFLKAYPVSFPYFAGMGLKDNIIKVDKIDGMTVKITLKDVDASFIQTLAMPFFIINSAEYMDHLLKTGKAGNINTQPIGTGPFEFVRYAQDSQIRYKANLNYFLKEDGPQVANVVFAITKDPSVRAQKLKAGECHIMGLPKPADLADLAKDPKLKVVTKPGFNVGFIYYNTEKKPFNDARVRRALDLAIGKDEIIKAVYGSAGERVANPLPVTQWSFNKDIKPNKQNIEEAKRLLAEAGYPNGFETSLWTLPVSRPYNPNGRLMGEMVQSDWKKIGVKVNLSTYEWGEYLKLAKDGVHETIMVGWTGDNGDPDNWLNTLFGCSSVGANNYSRFCYQPFEDLVVKAKQITDVAERTKLYEQAQVIYAEQVPGSPMATSIVTVPMSKKVQNFKISAMGGSLHFAGVKLEK